MQKIIGKIKNELKFRKIENLKKQGRQIITVHCGSELQGWIIL